MKRSTIFAFAAGLALVATAPVMAQEEESPEVVPFPYAYELTPAPGEATDLVNITIAFPETAVYFYANNQGRVAQATLENLTTGTTYQCMDATRNTRSTYASEYNMTFIEQGEEDAVAITEPGLYQLSIRTLTLDPDATEDADFLPWITAEYTIASTVNYSLDPEPGVVDNLGLITIDFWDNKNVMFYENSTMPCVVLENTTTGEVYNCYEPDRQTKAASNGAVYAFVFYNEDDEVVTSITEEGNYVLTIRAIYLEGEDGENVDIDPIVVNYTIGYPLEYVLSPENGEQVEQIDFVVIEFPNTKNVDFMPGFHPYVGVLENTTTGSIYTCPAADFAARYTTEGKAWYLYFQDENDVFGPVMEDGVYELGILGLVDTTNSNGVSEEGTPLPTIRATYYVGVSSSVASMIQADSYTVYDINGRKVITNGDANSLNSLNKGFYIINGKKVILRK